MIGIFMIHKIISKVNFLVTFFIGKIKENIFTSSNPKTTSSAEELFNSAFKFIHKKKFKKQQNYIKHSSIKSLIIIGYFLIMEHY